MAPSEPDWAGLPEHLLDLIYEKLDLLCHSARFGAVCLSWQSIAVHNRKDLHNKTSIPLLMIPTKDSSEKRRSLYSVTDGKVYDLQLSVPYNSRCCGSSYGWLVVFDETLAPTLFKPFQNTKTIRLPPLESVYRGKFAIVKVVLSANPDPFTPPDHEDYVVASIYSEYARLAFFKAGDKSWTYINKNLHLFCDVIFYRGRILAVTSSRLVVSLDVFNNQVTVIAPGDRMPRFCHVYLVESFTGDLLLVQRNYYADDEMPKHEVDKYSVLTKTFDVYKLVLHDQTGMVVDKIEVKSLGEETLFLGDNNSMSVLASKYPGLKHNSIYYTDDYSDHHCYGPHDIGIFSLDNRNIDQHYHPNPSQEHMPHQFGFSQLCKEIGYDSNAARHQIYNYTKQQQSIVGHVYLVKSFARISPNNDE